MKTSVDERHIGQSPGGTRSKLSAVLSQWRWVDRAYPPSNTVDNTGMYCQAGKLPGALMSTVALGVGHMGMACVCALTLVAQPPVPLEVKPICYSPRPPLKFTLLA